MVTKNHCDDSQDSCFDCRDQVRIACYKNSDEPVGAGLIPEKPGSAGFFICLASFLFLVHSVQFCSSRMVDAQSAADSATILGCEQVNIVRPANVRTIALSGEKI